jgi:hypothetical protein
VTAKPETRWHRIDAVGTLLGTPGPAPLLVEQDGGLV